jgi:hypothetical protein
LKRFPDAAAILWNFPRRGELRTALEANVEFEMYRREGRWELLNVNAVTVQAGPRDAELRKRDVVSHLPNLAPELQIQISAIPREKRIGCMILGNPAFL